MKLLTLSAAVLSLASIVQADTRMKVRYTTNGEMTETTVYTKGARQRLEYPDVIVIQQPDQQRMLQLDPKSKAYATLPANVSAVPVPAPSGWPRKGGVVMVTTATSSTGETREILGRTAKHIKTVTTQQPMPGACDTSQSSLEIDGWYADLGEKRAETAAAPPAPAAGCTDEYRAQSTGEPKSGFPLAYTITSRQGGKTSTTSMEVLELSTDTLDAALFEAPAGWTGANNTSDFAKLQAAAFAASAPAKNNGAMRIGVMSVADQSGKGLNQDFLVEQFRHALAGAGVDAIRVFDVAQAKQANCDYVLTGEVLEVKRNAINQVAGQAAKVSGLLRGGLGGFGKGGAAAAAASGQTTQSSDESVEAKLNYKLTPLDSSKPETTGTVMARSGAIISLKTAISLASSVTPMLMMAQMYNNPAMMQMMNVSMMSQQSSMALDPAMTGMNNWTRATNALSASQAPGASDAKAVNAAFDQIAKAISGSAK